MGANALANAKNEKVAAKILFDIVGLETEKYRLGHTKVSVLCRSLSILSSSRRTLGASYTNFFLKSILKYSFCLLTLHFRYGVLNVQGVRDAITSVPIDRPNDKEKQDRTVAKVILDKLGFDKEKYRLGYTKVFYYF